MRVFLIVIAGLAMASCTSTSGIGDMALGNTVAPEAAELVPATSPTAPADSAGEPTAAAENESDPNRMVCRTERATGQLRRERICRTAARWAEIREAGQASIHGRQSSQYMSPDERPH
ncbi:hypothetical protein [Hyphobacterium sp.]|uniref:hypothetical protein n=1 Tax=Hyphobacterium sp. TaxID=2004662 RepID=UPI003B530429